MKIAVIGTGITGMGCAWLLNQRHDITVYEAADRLGGHTNTVEVTGDHGKIAVDTGFIVYNEVNYPNLTQLFKHLDVPTQPGIMSFAVSVDAGALEYSGGSLIGLFGQKRNLLSLRFYRMIAEIIRFYQQAPLLLDKPGAELVTLGDYLADQGYSSAFIAEHILPMGAAIWSCTIKSMMEFPATSFIRFCLNHGLLNLVQRPAWRTVTGGSQSYLARLTAPYADRIKLGCPVHSVIRGPDGVEIVTATGERQRYDQVVLACHGDEAYRLLQNQNRLETQILGSFGYQENRAVLHRDARVMPMRRSVWSSWNYTARSDADADAALSVTYWMNLLQDLPKWAPDLFVTLNPTIDLDPALVEREILYHHPVFDRAAILAQQRLPALQGQGGVWYCGSYCGWGFHEDGFSAGIAVAQALDCPTPWVAAPAHAAEAVWPLNPASRVAA